MLMDMFLALCLLLLPSLCSLLLALPLLTRPCQNASYRAAIAEQLAVLKARNMPLTRILDIGAGTSLLALMAAEEAERLNMSVDVHTCEVAASTSLLTLLITLRCLHHLYSMFSALLMAAA